MFTTGCPVTRKHLINIHVEYRKAPKQFHLFEEANLSFLYKFHSYTAQMCLSSFFSFFCFMCLSSPLFFPLLFSLFTPSLILPFLPQLCVKSLCSVGQSESNLQVLRRSGGMSQEDNCTSIKSGSHETMKPTQTDLLTSNSHEFQFPNSHPHSSL